MVASFMLVALSVLPARVSVKGVGFYRRYLTRYTRPCPNTDLSCSRGAELLLVLPNGQRRAVSFVKDCGVRAEATGCHEHDR